ncbi:RNA ligase [Vibrio mangrovi]|nr:RNA ligase [Vibrio mangrovi]
MRYKYPRTPHLPWSPGATDDDVFQAGTSGFENRQVVVTEKMDGENTTIYRDFLHARSLDSRFHPSRSRVKALQAEIGYMIPQGWRVCGENVYARHSIAYESLPDYFLAFSLWNQENICLGWQESCEFFERLGLVTPKVLYQGIWDESLIRSLPLDTETQEGYVVRLAEGFTYQNFAHSVAKWVRTDHVVTEQHWMHQEKIPNQLLGGQDE